MTSSTKRAIYIFYFLVLMSAISWRLANAAQKDGMISDITIFETQDNTEISFVHTNGVEAMTDFSGEEHCLCIWFPKTKTADKLNHKAFVGRDFKALYLNGSSGNTTRTRAMLYMKRECLASVRIGTAKTVIKLTRKEEFAKGRKSEKTLLDPSESKNAPVVLSLSNAPLMPVLEELANSCGIELSFASGLPATFSGEFQTITPIEAIRQIAASADLELVRHGKGWLVQPSGTLMAFGI